MDLGRVSSTAMWYTLAFVPDICKIQCMLLFSWGIIQQEWIEYLAVLLPSGNL